MPEDTAGNTGTEQTTMATKKTKTTKTPQEILARWIEGASQITGEQLLDVLDAFQAGSDRYITIERLEGSVNYEKFDLEDLYYYDDEKEQLSGYVIVEWDDDGTNCVLQKDHEKS